MPTNRLEVDNALRLFNKARAQVKLAGYDWEIDWQRKVRGRPFSETELLREAAWVILCSGFSERAVRAAFDYVSLCFCDWESASIIASTCDICVSTASSGFRHLPKLNAILGVAVIVTERGFESFSTEILNDPIGVLRTLPFIGPVTSAHLAKNLGVDIAKNDRHLARLAKNCGVPNADALCELINRETGEPVSVIDVILWRFAVLCNSRDNAGLASASWSVN